MKTSRNLPSGLKESNQASTPRAGKLTVENQNGVDSLKIETVTGKLVDPVNPDPKTIDLDDIAWGLSRIPRFAGHSITEVPYNVAQHSVYVTELLEQLIKNEHSTLECSVGKALEFFFLNPGLVPQLLIKALIHDAHESYTGDIPSPIKRIPEIQNVIRIIEARLDHAIYLKLNLEQITDNEKVLIKFCDKLAQAIEGYQFMPSRAMHWDLPKPNLVMLQNFPEPLNPIKSYELFTKKYFQLAQQ